MVAEGDGGQPLPMMDEGPQFRGGGTGTEKGSGYSEMANEYPYEEFFNMLRTGDKELQPDYDVMTYADVAPIGGFTEEE